MILRARLSLFLMSCLALLPGLWPARTTASPPPDTVATARLQPGGAGPDGARLAGLSVTLQPGWKTYWRAPGEAGVPPVFDWTGSDNLAAVRVVWPRPVMFHQNGIQSIGYHDQVTLPLVVTPRDAKRPVHLRLLVDLGVCNKICVPVRFELTADLDASAQPIPDIARAMASQPRPVHAPAHCTLTPISDGMRLTAMVDIPPLGAGEGAAIETNNPALWVSGATTTRDGGRLTAVADLVPQGGAPFVLDRGGLTLTLISDDTAVELRGCPAPD